MGSTKLTKKELADRIGSPTKIARYELANKAEVKAFVDGQLEKLSAAVEKTLDEEVSAERKIRFAQDMEIEEAVVSLARRICELELTRWQRFKRWFNGFIEDVLFVFTSDPSQFPMDDAPQTTFGVLGDTHENPYDRLARSLREMPTECAEDLAENPVVQEAIEQLGGSFNKVPPMHALETLPEFHDLPEYTAEEMPSLHDTQRTHDVEKPQHDLDNRQGYRFGSQPGKTSPYCRTPGECPTCHVIGQPCACIDTKNFWNCAQCGRPVRRDAAHYCPGDSE